VTVFVGPNAAPGRGVVAIGSTHGDEYEGPVAIKHLLHELREEDVLGRIILIPLLNAVAFQAGRRDTPDDGVNLNRAFPGRADGSITQRIADLVTRFVFPQVHVVLDLHAGGEVARFVPLTSMHEISDLRQRKGMEETARGFGTRFVLIYQNATPGLLTSAAEKLGKITLGGEFGFGRALQAEGVSMAKQGVLSAAVRHEQLKGPAPLNRHVAASDQILVDSSSPGPSILAPFDGHFEP
jgi:predicted deacylase